MGQAMTTPTGIAGAADYHPAASETRCTVCNAPIPEAPVSVRVLPGRLGMACSAACVASPMWRGRLVLVVECEGEWI